MSIDLNIIGHLVLDDKTFHAVKPPKKVYLELGGPAAYSTMAIPLFDVKTRIITSIGRDFPEAYLHYFASIDKLEVETSITEKTTRFQHEIYSKKRTLRLLAQADNLDKFVQEQKGGKACLISPVFKETSSISINWAKENHNLVGIDIQGFLRDQDKKRRVILNYEKIEIDWITANVDIVKYSLNEVQHYTGKESFNTIFAALPKNNIQIITMGDRGLVYSDKGIIAKMKAPKLKEYDPTGAGDVLLTGLLHMLNKGSDLDFSISYGMALAAEKVVCERIHTLPKKNYEELAEQILETKAII